MAETLGPGVRDEALAPASSQPDSSFEERLRAVEAKLAARLEVLGGALAAQRDRLRDQEKAMVERIADVDDDRRLTGSKLQRRLQKQRDDFDTRLRRHGGLLALAVFLALVGNGLVATYVYLQSAPASLTAEVATLRQDLQRFSGLAQQDAQLQERLTTLADQVGQVASTVERQPTPNDSAGKERLEHLAAEQRRQAGTLETLQRNLQALVTAMPSRPAAPERPATAPPEPGPAKSAAPEPAKSAAPEPATAPPTARTHKTTVTDRPFALQLSGGRNRDTILALATGPNLPDRVYVYEYARRGRPWFVLIHSLHASSAEAQAALAAIPPKLRSQAPWIRPLPPGAELELIERKAGHN